MSPRAAICGGDDLRAAAAALGLEPCDAGRPDVILVDLRDPSACAVAAALEAGIPRVAVAGESERALAAALGYDASSIATTCEPAALGPLVVAALPRTPRRATRVVVVTAPRGGVGRTLLVANLARRLASRLTVAVVDATGTGALGWWLECAPRAWTELEGLTDELTAEHLAVVATETAGLRVIGGAPVAPTRALAESTVRAAMSLAELVLVDAPLISDDRGRALAAVADRALVLSYDDPPRLRRSPRGDRRDACSSNRKQHPASGACGVPPLQGMRPRRRGALPVGGGGRSARQRVRRAPELIRARRS